MIGLWYYKYGTTLFLHYYVERNNAYDNNSNTKLKTRRVSFFVRGESQRKDGKYDFRWTPPDGKRHSIYAPTLKELQRERKKARNQIRLKALKQKHGMLP